jgi:ferredoxin-NADP reductase
VLDEGELAHRDVYIVGPIEFVTAVEHELKAGGVAEQQLIVEVL